MSTLIRAQLLSSLRASVQELDEMIADTERQMTEHTFATPRCVRNDLRSRLKNLCDDRDALIAKIKEAEGADDILWDLQCAFSDATDCDGVSDDALRSALDHHGLVISRAKP